LGVLSFRDATDWWFGLVNLVVVGATAAAALWPDGFKGFVTQVTGSQGSSVRDALNAVVVFLEDKLLWAVLLVMVVGVARKSYELTARVRTVGRGLERELNEIRDYACRVEVAPIQPAEFMGEWDPTDGKVRKGYEVASVRFVNRPASPSLDSVAHDVAPAIRVTKPDGAVVFEFLIGQWCDESQAISALDKGPLVTVKRIDLKPGPILAKLPLIVSVKYPTVKGWFVFVAPAYIDNSAFHLEPGDYRVAVTLGGTDLRDTEFLFDLKDSGSVPALSEVSGHSAAR
jgi:hypothetical protein